MSFIRITKANIDTSVLELHPSRSFSSSSIGGVTGSVRVIAQSSPFFKETSKNGPFVEAPVDASSIEEFRDAAFGGIYSVDAIAATGSASGSWAGNATDPLADGLTLTFLDTAGNLFSAVTDTAVAYGSSTATVIGVDPGTGVTVGSDLVTAVKNSITQAKLYGVTATSHNTDSGNNDKLQVETPTADGTGYTLLLTASDIGYAGNQPLTGTLVDLASADPPRLTVKGLAGGTGANLSSVFEGYLTKVNDASQAARQTKYVEVLRFIPTNTFTSDTIRKNVFRKVLMPQYKTGYPDLEWAFMNNQSFHFVSSSAFPSASVLIYPDPLDTYLVMSGLTLSCNVKLSRTISGSHPYTAGTTIFRSSSYALSVVTGSQRDPTGKVTGFRLLLQLTGACDTPAQNVSLTSLPPYTFLSSDNVLKYNHWHNICAAWGSEHNSGTGSFYIDGVKDADAEFWVSTASINTSPDDFNSVFIGAHYNSSSLAMNGYFNSAVAAVEGIYDGGGPTVEPLPEALKASRFNGEINDIRIFSERISDDRILTGSMFGLTELPQGLVFYVPGFFVKESPKREVLLTPFQATTEATEEPFNVKLAYGVRGRDINLQNYVREFVQKKHPRLYYLTASTIDISTETYTANSFLLDIGANHKMHRAREMFILPADNGKFIPGWNLLSSGTVAQRPASGSAMSSFVNDLGNLNLSIVTLNDLMPTSSIFEGLTQANSDGTDNTANSGILQEIMGSSPESAGVDPGSGYTILQRTRDNSSNAVVIFDACNLFYGKRMMPGSIRIHDSNLSGTADTLNMTILDNDRGTLYRADADSVHATWCAIGYTIYEEGLSVIMNPNIPFFGREQFSFIMQGEQNIHILEVVTPALQGMLNSSSNPSFIAGTRDNYASSFEGTAFGISSIQFHDNNMNVIARTTLAQPILKTEFDKYMFRVKFDF